MTNHNIFRCRMAGGALAIVLLGTLTGCPAAAPVAPAVSVAAADPVAQPAVVAQPTVVEQPTVVVPDGLIYYPNYEVYYDPGARVYWYNQGGRWENGPSPSGLSVDVVLGSPSVRMDFRDSPANHHSQVVQQYPRNWQPTGAPNRAQPDHGAPDHGAAAGIPSERGSPDHNPPDRGPPDRDQRGN